MEPTRPRPRHCAFDEGAVTVELAVGFFAVVAMVALIVSVSAIGVTRSHLCHAVGVAARAASTGDRDPVAQAQQAFSVQGRGHVVIDIHRSNRWVTVSGEAPINGITGLVHPTITCEVSTVVESGVP
ncbi:pilus assembly protein TadE [Schaalia sp. ZJ405]|nr:pilus assembly protein TadE [Schaalia sp. ZJ405]